MAAQGFIIHDDIYTPIAEAMKDKVRIATGSYTGSGTYGSSNPCSVDVGFPFKMFAVVQDTGVYKMSSPYLYGNNEFQTYQNRIEDGIRQVVTVSGNTITWYTASGSALYQMNASGNTYTWFAIG